MTTSGAVNLSWLSAIGGRGWLFAACVLVCYALTLLPSLIRNQFDPSVFIVAGATYVDATQTPSRIVVRPGSGYDGQFYYRLAMAPLDFGPRSHGVQFDHGPLRMQRIGYPTLAWIASFGRPELAPLVLPLVNLAGIAALALVALSLCRRLQLPVWTAAAIMMWPGLPVSLSRDTTEIWAATFLLAALVAYFARRFRLYALLGVLCVLTRETGILAFGGIFLYSALRREWPAAVASGAIAVPFLAWRLFLTWRWDQGFPTGDLSWPFVGAIQTLARILTGVYTRHAGMEWLVMHAYALAAVAFVVAFAAFIITTVFSRARTETGGPLAFALVPMLCLMSLLTANGPWIESIAFFRVFTEVFAVGCIFLAQARLPKLVQRSALMALPLLWAGSAVMAITSLK